jgi:hypothetical protein
MRVSGDELKQKLGCGNLGRLVLYKFSKVVEPVLDKVSADHAVEA